MIAWLKLKSLTLSIISICFDFYIRVCSFSIPDWYLVADALETSHMESLFWSSLFNHMLIIAMEKEKKKNMVRRKMRLDLVTDSTTWNVAQFRAVALTTRMQVCGSCCVDHCWQHLAKNDKQNHFFAHQDSIVTGNQPPQTLESRKHGVDHYCEWCAMQNQVNIDLHAPKYRSEVSPWPINKWDTQQKGRKVNLCPIY